MLDLHSTLPCRIKRSGQDYEKENKDRPMLCVSRVALCVPLGVCEEVLGHHGTVRTIADFMLRRLWCTRLSGVEDNGRHCSSEFVSQY